MRSKFGYYPLSHHIILCSFRFFIHFQMQWWTEFITLSAFFRTYSASFQILTECLLSHHISQVSTRWCIRPWREDWQNTLGNTFSDENLNLIGLYETFGAAVRYCDTGIMDQLSGLICWFCFVNSIKKKIWHPLCWVMSGCAQPSYKRPEI